jgi:fumarate reductase subunit D
MSVMIIALLITSIVTTILISLFGFLGIIHYIKSENLNIEDSKRESNILNTLLLILVITCISCNVYILYHSITNYEKIESKVINVLEE